MSESIEELRTNRHNNKQICNKLICNKHNIILSTTNKKNEYLLTFKIHNPRIYIGAFTGWKIYDLIYTLNRDILEDMKITIKENNIRTYSYLFKRFGAELGILQRCLTLDMTSVSSGEHNIQYISKPSNDKVVNFSRSEPVISNFASFDINIVDDHTMDVKYLYHIDLDEQLPKSMENIAGILIKKLFWRFKTFIENIE